MNLAEQTRKQISISEAINKVTNGLRNGMKSVAIQSDPTVKSYLKSEGFEISDSGEQREGEFHVSLPDNNNQWGDR